MKKTVLAMAMTAVCCACCNKQVSNTDAAEAELTQQNDSVERERIFADRGDTITGGICYRMDVDKALEQAAILQEKRSGGEHAGFMMGEVHFMPLEKVISANEMGSGVIGDFYGGIYAFDNKVYKLVMESYPKEMTKRESVVSDINTLIEAMESEYGKCSSNELLSSLLHNPEKQVFFQNGNKLDVVKWEAGDKEITIWYSEEEDGDKSDWKIHVVFIDKPYLKEIKAFLSEMN